MHLFAENVQVSYEQIITKFCRLLLQLILLYSFYSPNNGQWYLKKLQKYTPKKSHTHAAECPYAFKIVHVQEVCLLHVTNRQAI